MPVLPLVASTIVAPADTFPSASATSIIESAGRSLTLPPGFKNSALTQMPAPLSGAILRSFTSGVLPTTPSAPASDVAGRRTDSALRDRRPPPEGVLIGSEHSLFVGGRRGQRGSMTVALAVPMR